MYNIKFLKNHILHSSENYHREISDELWRNFENLNSLVWET